MRELDKNLENDPSAMQALRAEVLEFSSQLRHLTIPAVDHLLDAICWLNRLVCVSPKVLAAKGYYILLRHLQRITVTATVLAETDTQAMPSNTAEQIAAKRRAYEKAFHTYGAQLSVEPVGQVEGEQLAANIHHMLCSEDVFCAACSFLQVAMFKRRSIYYLRGESPVMLEAKKNFDSLDLTQEVILKTMASNISRPESACGVVERNQIALAQNTLAKFYSLYVKTPDIVQWLEEGQTMLKNRSKADACAHFELSTREYSIVMAMAGQMGLSSPRARKSRNDNTYTLNNDLHELVIEEANRRGYTPRRMLNTLVHDFFLMLKKRKDLNTPLSEDKPEETELTSPQLTTQRRAKPTAKKRMRKKLSAES